MSTTCSYTIEAENQENSEDKAVVKSGSVLNAVLCRLSQIWPVRFVMRSFRGFWWLLGFSPAEKDVSEAESPSARQCRTGKKRLRRVTRIVLAFLPRRLQSALGYPVCTSIGCTVSPEVRSSPTKPSGKGSKRKQDDVDEDEDNNEEGQPLQSWVEVLNQEMGEEEDNQADPDYEPSSVGETDSEEYHEHNDTESDIEVQEANGYREIKDLPAEAPAEA
ncbi:hypothetical protein COCON_G00059410 [Conger conger]|uniref:Uncharacterized protein n=1 Tax=Conger conger TaxID=82655 RepID=A0A9Q1DR47_CONCO|nr:oogenesis-related [Conger conger]KAJ8278875.1 hypothetical protein COCON_G00059410 [Conger conger]